MPQSFKWLMPCFSGLMPGDLMAVTQAQMSNDVQHMVAVGGFVYELLIVLGKYKFFTDCLFTEWKTLRKSSLRQLSVGPDTEKDVLAVLRAAARGLAAVPEEEHRLWTSQVGVGNRHALGFLPLLKALKVAKLAVVVGKSGVRGGKPG